MERTDFQAWTLGIISKTLNENREYFYKITEQADKIIVWLVGFSITSIALSIAKSTDLNIFLKNLTNYVLIFGSLTVIMGVLYRVFVFIAQSMELKILLEFDVYVKFYTNPPIVHVGREIKDQNTYYEIVDFIKADFDKEFEKIDVSNLKPNQVTEIRQKALDYYNFINDRENKLFEQEKEEVKNVMRTFLGNSESEVDKAFNNPEPSKLVRRTYWFSLYSCNYLAA